MIEPPLIEHVYYHAPGPPQRDTWWSRYKDQLIGLSPTARASVEADSRFILERGIFGTGEPNPETWPNGRTRTGLVMGSVQSGKTASMLGVSALALDHGVDIIVILAGTRRSLWRQTYDRVVQQLDSGPDGAAKGARRMLCPAPAALSDTNVPLSRTYALVSAAVKQRLLRSRPIIMVAMKQTDHLRAVADSLRKRAFPVVSKLGRPVHMLVLDDEADDGSILDALAETEKDPVYGDLKQIPRTIANLWDPPQGAPRNLFSTYIAYTATPQANLLQEDHNPLAPRDFLFSLRTPLDIGYTIDLANPSDLTSPRSSTYPEPQGLTSFYTGGEVFYRRGLSAGLCRPLTPNPADDRAEAVRAFLVAGAIRLHRSHRTGPATATTLTFDTAEEARAEVMGPHSMLYHPSANIEEHFESAVELLLWAGVSDRQTARRLLADGVATLPDALSQELASDPSPWIAWLDRYRQSAKAIENEFNVLHPNPFPDWPTTQALLVNEIIPGTRVSVVNSDPTADDRPSYTPQFDQASQRWKAPRDLSTIFVSGNVMARGLTLEGMTTALFQRSSSNPLADTQMQMQRWFGYRGSYIELCRVFASEEQFALFSAYHDIDEAIRTAINHRMMSGAPEPMVLQGMSFNATGKIANVRNYPLSPGGRPFITLLNSGAAPDPNAELVSDLFRKASSSPVVEGTRRLGQILDEPLSLLQLAEWLDRLTYENYSPGDGSDLAKHWAQVETRVSTQAPLEPQGLYRPPVRGRPADAPRRVCPYSIAAYLRLWAACLVRPVNGLFVTGEPGHPWSMADLEAKRAQQPRFWFGIRYGDGDQIRTGPLANLPFEISTTTKEVSANGELANRWGTSAPTAGPGQFRGDLYFDYHHRNMTPPTTLVDSSWRPAGSDGQALIYVNQLAGQAHPSIAIGLCLPAGGPEQFAATRATTILP